MQCILIGVCPPLKHDSVLAVHSSVRWLKSTKIYDEDNHVQLICGLTDINNSTEDIVDAISKLLGSEYTCELWATAPALLPLKPLSGYDFTHQQVTGSLEDYASSTMQEWGIFVQPSLIDKDEVKELRDCINNEITNIETLIKLHHPNIKIGQDIISFKEISSRGNERFDLLLQPTTKAADFVNNVLIERVRHILQRILNGKVEEDVDFNVSVVYSKPNASDQGWHADGDHQNGTHDVGLEVEGWKHLAQPYALCLFIPLIDLDEDTGYTQFWPGSHVSKRLAGFGQVAEITQSTWNGRCNAGDAIWYDYRLMHRGIRNTSTMLRPVLQILFKKKWYKEKRNYGKDSVLPTNDCNKNED